MAGVGPIPESAVDRKAAELSPREVAMFKTCVRAMESELNAPGEAEQLRPGMVGEMFEKSRGDPSGCS